MQPLIGESQEWSDAGIAGTNTADPPGKISQAIGISAASLVFGDGGSVRGYGVMGQSTHGAGVCGIGEQNGVFGQTSNSAASGVYGENKGEGFGVAGRSVNGVGVLGVGKTAARFEGKVEIYDGDIEVHKGGDVKLFGEDCAEEFYATDAGQIEPGTVMVIGNDGSLRESHQAYDKRVAGIVSGAGAYKPAIVLGRHRTPDRVCVALVGKVYCKVDARYSPVEVGDLLTTSPTLGHAMKATESAHAFGAVIGKALRRLGSGQALVPVLVALQ
jgi:hypothetical protein